MSFKEMNEFITYLTFKCKTTQNLYQIHEENRDQSLRGLIMVTLSKLDKEERRMIENEYFFNDRSWWYEYYSRSTFYRFKKHCMIKFLSILNQII